jgi:hypothetical protein
MPKISKDFLAAGHWELADGPAVDVSQEDLETIIDNLKAMIRVNMSVPVFRKSEDAFFRPEDWTGNRPVRTEEDLTEGAKGAIGWLDAVKLNAAGRMELTFEVLDEEDLEVIRTAQILHPALFMDVVDPATGDVFEGPTIVRFSLQAPKIEVADSPVSLSAADRQGAVQLSLRGCRRPTAYDVLAGTGRPLASVCQARSRPVTLSGATRSEPRQPDLVDFVKELLPRR